MRIFQRACALVIALFLALTPALALDGMDVSVFQGSINFEAARDDGIEAVYIRSSYGLTAEDPLFRQNYQRASAAGLPLGFYHYLNAETPARARAEADHFVSLIAGLNYQCRPVLDYEQGTRLTPAEATLVARTFLERVEERLGQRPMVYASASNAQRLDLGAYPLWVAQWQVSRPQLEGSAWSAWTGWQYTATGRVAGVRGNVDRDRFTDGILLSGEGNAFSYSVRRGDTLSGIARRFGTTVNELVRRNNIADPNRIYVGQILQIPGEAPETYTVVRGDTLSGIARRFGTTVNELVRRNNIADPNRIYVGQILRLK